MRKLCNNAEIVNKGSTLPLEQPEQNTGRVHIDYADPRNGLHYLILVGVKTKWLKIRILSKAPSTKSTIALLENIFNAGYPKRLVSDNVTIFVSEMG